MQNEGLADGVIDDEGNAVFTVHFTAIYFNLFKDEVIDCVVDEVRPVSR